jgi:hypothetical protein
VFSISQATVIVDVLLSGHPFLHSLADQRVYHAVQKLSLLKEQSKKVDATDYHQENKTMIDSKSIVPENNETSKSSTTAPANSSEVAVTEESNDTIIPPVVETPMDIAEPAEAEVSTTVDQDVSTTVNASAETAVDHPNNGDAAVIESSTTNDTNDTATTTMDENRQENGGDDDGNSNLLTEMISDDIAQLWKKRFQSACRSV